MQTGLTRILMVVACSGVLAAGCAGDNRPSGKPETMKRGAANDNKVILFVIDGPRHTEAFDDPAHTHVPRMWDDLRMQGAVVPQFFNNGRTLTNPGHAAIITGTWQDIANDGSERPTKPTLFEYYRKAYAVAPEETYVVSGKGKLDVCSYSTHPDFGAPFGATESVGFEDDQAVFDELTAILRKNKPRLVLACFPTVDRTGHGRDYGGYLAAISQVDSLLHQLWLFLQDDPFYADQTYLIVTNDHGRHDEKNGGFANHGCACDGCRRIMFMALGPEIKAAYTASDDYDQRDICNTVAEILELSVLHSEGRVIEEIFKAAP
ncbi:MAG: alkaline phosphatase family protein [Candidatus Krumholzibacteria bacterium]|nr:alkaline phosphatase family protein [Candidatus Krumholzibacteria bacterium]